MHISVNLRSVTNFVVVAGDGFKLPDSPSLDNCPDASGVYPTGDLKMNSSQVPSRGRPIKFTPEGFSI